MESYPCSVSIMIRPRQVHAELVGRGAGRRISLNCRSERVFRKVDGHLPNCAGSSRLRRITGFARAARRLGWDGMHLRLATASTRRSAFPMCRTAGRLRTCRSAAPSKRALRKRQLETGRNCGCFGCGELSGSVQRSMLERPLGIQFDGIQFGRHPVRPATARSGGVVAR
jgi:hypothetical protein